MVKHMWLHDLIYASYRWSRQFFCAVGEFACRIIFYLKLVLFLMTSNIRKKVHVRILSVCVRACVRACVRVCVRVSIAINEIKVYNIHNLNMSRYLVVTWL